jgi:flagellar motility protein MotE (MotC chaperone)
MVLRTYGRNAPDVFSLIVAISLVAAVPVCAQAQKPWVTKDDAQKVVTIISGDKAKTQTYCEIQDVGEQMERAYEMRNLKLVDELLQNIDALEKTLGPEYVALMDRLVEIDPEKDKLGAEIMSVFDALGELCPR